MDEAEQAAELAATAEVKEEDVRAKVIEEFGFDEIDDKDRIDKLVAKEVESSKKLSQAIGQKIKHRTEAEALKNDPRLKVTPPPAVEPKATTEDVETLVQKSLEQRDLDALDYSDDLKKEIQRIAQVQGISIKAATRDPYIVFKIDEWDKAQKAEEATISRTNRSGSKTTFTADVPPKVDMSTDEGRKTYDEWKKWAIANGG